MRKLFVFSILLCCYSIIVAQEGIKVTDMLKIKSLSNINTSRDGSKAVFTVTSIEPDGDSKLEYKYVNQLWTINTDGSSQPHQLSGKEGSSQGVLSPDGKTVAFIRSAEGKPQVFLIPLDGGEAQQLTHFRYGAGAPRWSPDGKKIIFSASINFKDLYNDSILNPGHSVPTWSLEKPGYSNRDVVNVSVAKADPDGDLAAVRSYLDNNVTDKKAKVVNKLNFQDETDVSSEMSWTHFFMVDAIAGATPRAITHGFYNYYSAELTPDGKQLVLGGNVDSTSSDDRSLESEIFVADSNGANMHLLLGGKGKIYQSPRISPSGKWIAFQYGSTSFVTVPELAIMPLNGTANDVIVLPLDRNKSGFTWSGDEKYLYVTAQSNGGAPLYRFNLKTKQAEQLSDFDTGIISFGLAGSKILFVKTAVADPFELYLSDAAGKNAKLVSAFNTGWLKSRKLSFPEKKSFTNGKGQTIEYWLMKPINYVEGQKFPLILDIHGGPSAMWGPGETSMWHEFQFYCSKGYGVVYCNPRGSGGYGNDFLRANLNDWGTGPTSDVLTALDNAVAKGWADTSRLFVTGGSYAGYLVAWIIAHDHRFRAACSQRGVYDLATFFGEGNAWRLVPNYFGGYPWEAAAKLNLERESPITYVQNITTPYLIFHGDNDRRTGFVQSEMLYRSLKVLGRPVEYVRHPAGTHELTRSGNNRQRIDQMLRTWEFFERYKPLVSCR